LPTDAPRLKQQQRQPPLLSLLLWHLSDACRHTSDELLPMLLL
jgi:hypothetical protein